MQICQIQICALVVFINKTNTHLVRFTVFSYTYCLVTVSFQQIVNVLLSMIEQQLSVIVMCICFHFLYLQALGISHSDIVLLLFFNIHYYIVQLILLR